MYRTLNVMLVLAICGWTAVTLGSLLYHARDAKRHIQHIAHETATESIQKDLLYRYWAAQHGGVYVPVTGSTPPNPHLDFVQERDITTPSGRRLTLLNPEYMTRQVHELGRTFDEVQAHITSLKPLRPENAPDPWEARALRTIEQGAKEFGEVVEFQGAPHYRLMQPFYTHKPCLTCHAAQGYRQGELRGGISASVPMSLFSGVSRDHMTFETKHFGIIWVLGLAGMTMANVFVRRRIREREAAVHAVEESEQRLRSVVDNAPFGAHLYHLEPDGRLIFTGANDAASRMLGIDHTSLAGKTIEEAFPALPESICSEYRSVAMTGEAREFEHVAYDEGTIRGVFDVHAVQVAQMQVGVFFRDITEKHRAEAAIRASEERFRTIVSTAREGIVSIDEQENIYYVNGQMATMLGYRPEEMIGRPIRAFMHPDEREDHARQIDLRRKGLAAQYERRYLHRDGDVVRTIVSASPLLREDDAFAGAFGMVTDITAQAEMQEQLATSERQLRTIFDTLQAGIILVDPSGTITFANRRMAEMFKCPLERVIGTAYTEHVHPDQRSIVDMKMRQLMSGEVDSVLLERHYLAADGSDFWGYLSGRRLEDEQGRIVSLVGIIADITERKLAEQELRISRESLSKAQRIAEFGIWEWDISTQKVTWNEEVYRLYGLDPAAGPPSYDMVLSTLLPEHREKFSAAIRTAFEEKAPFEGEYAIQRPNGEVRYTHTVGEVAWDENGAPVTMFGVVQDITTRKTMELALQESEARLKEAQRIGRIGNWERDAVNDRLWWSDEVYRIFGFDPSKAVTFEDFLARVHQEDRDRVRLSIQGAIEQGRKEWQTEYRIQLPDGAVRHLYESAQAEKGPDGTVIRRRGIVQDITERHQAEEALRRSEEFTRSIIESEPECVKILGPDGVLRFMNRAGLKMMEADTYEAVVGRSVMTVIVPKYREAFEDLNRRVFQGETGMLEFEIVGLKGTRRWLETHAVPQRDRSGTVESILGITRDVTERKHAEQELRESRTQLHLALQGAKMGIWCWDISQNKRTFDEQVCRILGIDPATFQGTPEEFFGALHPDDREQVKAALTRTVEENAAYEPEYRVVWPDRSEHYITARGTLIRDEMGRPQRLIGIVWDVTDRRLAEERHRKLEDQLLQSQKMESVGRLAGGVAHDINNMLTPIFGYADMLGMRVPADDTGRSDIEEIVSAANKIKDMTQQLLAFARKQTLDMRPVDLNMVISRFSKMLRRSLREDISITLNLAASAGAALADERQLELVVLNLALNAQDAMAGGGSLAISTKDVIVDQAFTETRPGMSSGRYLELRIQDNGAGMDAATRSQIFEPFFTTKGKGKGTGLGLATVYGIVKQHKGYIEVLSALGHGTTFVVYLPAADAVLVSKEEMASGTVRQGSETVLVVEDQADVLRIVKQLLEALGYQVLTALNSETAAEIMRTNRSSVDLLLTDVIMPGTNGKELYERLRAGYPRLKVLYMSGYPADVISTHGVLDKSVHFLRKPFSVQDLSHQVREALDHPVAGTA